MKRTANQRGVLLGRLHVVREELERRGVGYDVWAIDSHSFSFVVDGKTPLGEIMERIYARWSDVQEVGIVAPASGVVVLCVRFAIEDLPIPGA